MRKKTIRRIVVPQVSVADGATAAVDSIIGSLNGTIRQFTVTVNDNTNNVTATVAFLDADDYVMHSEAAIAENATTAFQYWTLSGTDLPLALLVDDTITVRMTPSGDPGASGMTVDIVFYVDEG
jgi:hypothetical protein